MDNTKVVPEPSELRERMGAVGQEVVDITRMAKDRAVDGTKQWVKEHSLPSIGIAAGVGAGIGLAIGLLIWRGRE